MSEEPKAGLASHRRPFRDRVAVRFPVLIDLAAPAALMLSPGSPTRRRGLKLAFRAAWDGISRGDSEVARLLYERDAEVFLFGAEGLGLADRYSGAGGWTDFIGDIFENFAEPRFTTQRVRDGGDRVVAEIALTASGRMSGFPVEDAVVTIYHLSSRGKIARQDVFWHADSWDRALEAAGLSD